ncbi:M16 family metallopeptidase [Sinorhizobium meliloti]|uniref:M16 family metallopeptidase n=1 Tax=Rhizobium meliloti TaxID=382 RepID=UPI001F463C46|nr:pitrilysin family protein [Sinorhizobium meliloti]
MNERVRRNPPCGITLPFDRESKGSNFRASSIRVTVCPEFRDLSERHDVHDLPSRKPPTRFAGWRETRDIPGQGLHWPIGQRHGRHRHPRPSQADRDTYGLVQASVGGNEYASTSWTYTNYYQQVPKDYLKTCMAYETDRMTGLILTDEIVDMERQVVLAERGMGCDSNPENILHEALHAGAFSPDPCGRPIIGWQHEIETLGREDALAYYHRFYTPENAILVVAGDVDPDAVMDMAETIYGAITPTGASFQRSVVRAPPVRTQRLLTLVDENVHQPAFTRIHVVPSMMATGPHAAALKVLAFLLGGGNASYLHEALIVNNRMAISVGASYWSNLFRDLAPFRIDACPAPGVSLTDLDDAIENALEMLRRTGFSADDIQRAKSRIVANAIYQKDDHSNLALQYGVAASLGLSVEDVALWQERIKGVTTEDIRNALTLLERSTGIVGYLTPPVTDA